MRDLFALNWQAWVSLLLALAIVAICLRIYGRLLGRVRAGRGKVGTEPFGLPDLLLSLVLMSWFGSTAVHGFARAGTHSPVTDSAIVLSGLLFALVVAAVALFLKVRQISVVRLMGLRRSPFFVLTSGGSLLLAALPLIFLATFLVQWFAGEEPEPQEVVKYFSNAAAGAQWGRVALAAALAAVIAPMTEEFLFRGYFYAVLRRYLGALPALAITAALFASIHLSAPSFAPLFILASCLTLAYEATGCLWTPVLMHAAFNAIMLGSMLFNAFHP